ncbi:MAG: hypothetical protein ACI9R3_001958 [Verrucomicrobiales bacterium]|jgi:hypothetical protein
MGKQERTLLKDFRPRRFSGRGDKYLGDIAGDLRRCLEKVQDEFSSPLRLLDREDLIPLAVVLVEFAEDIHCDLGIWRALETWQCETLGSPLPLFVERGDSEPLVAFDSRRIRYLL